MVVIPSGYTLRAPEPKDSGAVAACLAASDIATFGEPDDKESDVLTWWSLPRFSLSTDAWLVIDSAGEIASYADLWEKVLGAEAWLQIRAHPAHEGRGLSAALLEVAERRAAQMSPSGITIVDPLPTARASAAALLMSRGFKPTRHDWRMAIDVEAGLQPPKAPQGIEIRAFDEQTDARGMYQTVMDSFQAHRHFEQIPYEEWEQYNLRDPLYDPSLCFVARDGDRMPGALFAVDAGEFGWVRTLGVLDAWRGRGIGRALLESSFAAFAARGRSRVMLGVDSGNSTGATRLYESAGMRVVREFDFYEKRL